MAEHILSAYNRMMLCGYPNQTDYYGFRQRQNFGSGTKATNLVRVISSWALTVAGSSGCLSPVFPLEPWSRPPSNSFECILVDIFLHFPYSPFA